ncbi:hypothetical protein BDN72DRAFT_956580 [Pluteus cervinus]|uniref:Uncharacterized protein n=1 Tax=Pluteus cervinus TaxID=181527 RepID=A0ACD3B6R2_9AGAR|nr:hypothetical protein BDN72DRAFT_956580 [Pluteus cervinus]
MASTTRRPAVLRQPTRTKAKTSALPTAAQLADQLASGLTISNVKGKGKSLSPDQRRAESMRAINSASQSLSASVQAGWKASKHLPKDATARVMQSINDAEEHLALLRGSTSGDINLDIERAAVSILGKLISLELFDIATQFTKPIHANLCKLLKVTSVHSFVIPLGSRSQLQDAVTLTLISTYLALSFGTVAYTLQSSSTPTESTKYQYSLDSFAAALFGESGTLLSWLSTLCSVDSILPKHIDSMLTRSYTYLTKSVSTQHAPMQAAFSIRMYGLTCLACASVGTVEIDTLWEQAVKFGGAWIRAISAQPTTSSGYSQAEEEASKVISKAYSDFVSTLQTRDSFSRLSCGKGWLSFCEYWLEITKRNGDISMLNRVVGFMKNMQPSEPRSTTSQHLEPTQVPLPESKNPEHAVLHAAKLCANLAQMTALVEQDKLADVSSSQRQELSQQLKSTSTMSVLVAGGDLPEELLRAKGKVDRAIERLRRAATRYLERTQSHSGFPDEGKNLVNSLLEVVVETFAAVLQQVRSNDFLTRLLDGLFVLTRSLLNPNDARTHIPAYNTLQRAMAILDGLPSISEDPTADEVVDVANYMRCISGAWYNMGGILYQATRYGATVGFLKESCELGGRALEAKSRPTPGSTSVTEDKEKVAEGWQQLEEGLHRRWELLAVCFNKIGDRRATYDAFQQCLATFPYASSGLAQRISEQAPEQAFESTSGTKQLSTNITRVTYLGACELLLPPSDVSLIHLADTLGKPLVGALIERQIVGLERSQWKESVRTIILGLLNDALEVYSDAELPVRKARILLKFLEFTYRGQMGDQTQSRPEALAQQVECLLSNLDLGQDRALFSYAVQYRVAGLIWSALHVHRQAAENQQTFIVQQMESACNLLSTLIGNKSPSEPQVVSKLRSPKAGSAAKRGAKVASVPKLRSAKKTTTPQVPVTPKPNRRKALQTISPNVDTPPKQQTTEVAKSVLVFDDFGKFVTLLQLAASVSGLLGLTLQKLRILDLVRRVCERYQGSSSEGYVLASISLAEEYAKLGKIRRATNIFNGVLEVVKVGKLSDEVGTVFYLKFAEALAIAEDIDQSSSLYLTAMTLSDRIEPEDKNATTIQRVHSRVGRLERAALAAQVVSLIQFSKANVSSSVEEMLQALRLWNRAADTLSRLNSLPANPSEENPFSEQSNQTEEGKSTQIVAGKPARKQMMDNLEYRVTEGLLNILHILGERYFTRGSVREAEYFAVQAHDLAESVNAPAMLSRALARKGELQMWQGMFEESHTNIAKAGALLSDVPGVDLAEIRRLWAAYNERTEQHQDAEQLYGETRGILAELDSAFKQFDNSAFGPRKSVGMSLTEIVLPEKVAIVLRELIMLLSSNGSEYTNLLEALLALPESTFTKAEESALLAKLSLQNVYARFRSDMFLSSIAESTIALPMGMTSKNGPTLSISAQDILAALEEAEGLAWANFALVSGKGNVSRVRNVTISLALIKAFQTSLGKSGSEISSLASNLLDASTGVTLRRELLEVITHKFPDWRTFDDLQWPLIDAHGTLLPRPIKKPSTRFLSEDVMDTDEQKDLDSEDQPLKAYWDSIRERYQNTLSDPASTTTTRCSELPSNWAVVHIIMTEDKTNLFISRQQGGDFEPIIFCVPLRGRRDNGEDDEDFLTYDDAIQEFKEIVSLSDAGTKAAANVAKDDKEAKAGWWKERGELDTRMKELLENIEFCWLGGFKTILRRRSRVMPESIAELRPQLEKLFQRSLRLQDKQPKTKGRAGAHKKTASQSQLTSQVNFDDNLMECFSALSPKCKDEEIEDLIFFVLDLYQFHGVSVAIAEVDVTQLVVDIRAVLEDHMAKVAKRKNFHGRSKVTVEPEVPEHLFLVLDKDMQGLPWESIPILRGRSVSRVPNMDFLLDRIEYIKLMQPLSTSGNIPPNGLKVDGRKGYYVLNPSGDLDRTEGRFKGWAEGMRKVGWEGTIGKPPSEQQLLDALRKKELLVYFGHGGAEQYARTHKIRNLPRCAATMLWGCSSGILREVGDFDRVGTPHSYMLAGCPTLVANLWDVTDRDIDKFSQAVFDQLHLNPGEIETRNSDAQGDEVSVALAVACSRDVCKLKYLTGAAPVVYGIPFYI